MIHTTIGLYGDGSFKINGVKPEHLKEHIEYNLKYRGGRALFVDGKCVHNGYKSDEEVKVFEKRILEEPKRFTRTKCTAPYH